MGSSQEIDPDPSSLTEPGFIEDEWLGDLLDRASVNGHRRDVLVLLVRHGDIPLAQLAAALSRGYAATRQDKHRALATLRAALRLTDQEDRVYSASHRGISTEEIGVEMGLAPSAIDELLATARHKIMQFLYPEPGVDH